MTFTYNARLTSRRDRIRFHAGDVDPDNQGLSDEEIDAIILDEGNDFLAAANVRDAIMARWMQRSQLADRRQLGDHEQEYDFEHGPGAYAQTTHLLRLKGLRSAGRKTTRIMS